MDIERVGQGARIHHRNPRLTTQKLVLLLQCFEDPGHLPDNGFIGRGFGVLVKDKGEVEHESISLELFVLEVDGKTDNFAGWGGDGNEPGADLDLWDQKLGDRLKVDQGRGLGEDRAFGDLVQYLGALDRVEGAVEDGEQPRESHGLLGNDPLVVDAEQDRVHALGELRQKNDTATSLKMDHSHLVTLFFIKRVYRRSDQPSSFSHSHHSATHPTQPLCLTLEATAEAALWCVASVTRLLAATFVWIQPELLDRAATNCFEASCFFSSLSLCISLVPLYSTPNGPRG